MKLEKAEHFISNRCPDRWEVFGKLPLCSQGYFAVQVANEFSNTGKRSLAVPGARHDVTQAECLGSGTSKEEEKEEECSCLGKRFLAVSATYTFGGAKKRLVAL